MDLIAALAAALLKDNIAIVLLYKAISVAAVV